MLFIYTHFINNYVNVGACGALQLIESPHAHAHAYKIRARAYERILVLSKYINTRINITNFYRNNRVKNWLRSSGPLGHGHYRISTILA